jgi:4-hydroxysphinganine ceramide fatty acyl 2-hydroxylase
VLWWTLAEYYLHRFFFHSEDYWLPNIPRIFAYHFMLHGIHHAFPMDRMRLVFPPLPGYVVHYVFIIIPMSWVIPENILYGMVAGELIGYVLYDMIHYYIHHATPKDFYFKDLKRYHMLHHYKMGTTGFGVSNKLWDYVFGSEIKY